MKLKECVEELEHQCVQLSGEIDTTGDYVAFYHTQRAVLEERYQEKLEYVSWLVQDREDMKEKLAELQELVIWLEGKCNEGEGNLLTAAESTSGPSDPSDPRNLKLPLGRMVFER
jgi:hypothetical protein